MDMDTFHLVSMSFNDPYSNEKETPFNKLHESYPIPHPFIPGIVNTLLLDVHRSEHEQDQPTNFHGAGSRSNVTGEHRTKIERHGDLSFG